VVNRERLLKEFLDLLRISNPTFAERDIAEVLRSKLKALGLNVIEDQAGQAIGGNCGNLIGTLPPSLPIAPVLMLSAHMDCVEPCKSVNPAVKGEIISSSGNTVLGGDDKAGLVSILEALRIVQEQGIPHGEILVVFTVGEEGGLLGAKNIDPSLLQADFGYVLDSSGSPGKIIIQAPGENGFQIKILGRAAHAGIAPEAGLNAIILAARALSQIPDGRINENTTANIGTITGGFATNIVPETVEINGETRSHNQAELKSLTDEIVSTIERVVKEHGGRSEATVEKHYDSYVLSENKPVVTVAKAAISALGLPLELKPTGGGSDANYFNAYGIPCAVLGIGTQKVHTTEEFININDLCNTAELALELIRLTVMLHNNP
jgi:tripeptide aminopeptidase